MKRLLEDNAMRQGDDIHCGNCGRDAFVVSKSVMDGWTKKGEVFACSACGAEIAPVPFGGSDVGGAGGASPKATERAASFLGVGIEDGKRLEALDEESRFCRDCAHFISHPFLSRCSLHGKDVNPMDDCGDFRGKSGGG